jgi:hypothetical protein
MGANPNALDPDLRAAMNELQQWLGSQRVILTITSTVRSGRDQDFLWKRFKAGNSGGLPAAPPGHSAHEYGWAFDAVVSPVEYQVAVGKAWEQLWGGKWGGSKDPVHFELPGASQLAWQLGESGAQQQAPIEDTLGAKATNVVMQAIDLFEGSSVAGLLQLFPALSENEALQVLSSPYEEFLKWLIYQINLPSFR